MFCAYYGNVVAERKVREHKNGMHNVNTYHTNTDKNVYNNNMFKIQNRKHNFALFFNFL